MACIWEIKLQWGSSQAEATKVVFHIQTTNTNYCSFVGFYDWEGTQTSRIAFFASKNRTVKGFDYCDYTTALRYWFVIGY